MTPQLSLYVLGLALATALSASVAVSALRHSDRRGSLSLGLTMLAVAEWCGVTVLEATATTIPEKILWTKIAYIGSLTAGPLVLHFAATLTRREAVLTPSWVRVLIWSVPAVALLLVFTNELHGLIWTSFTYVDIENRVLVYGHGPAYYVMVAHIYALLTGASILSVWGAFDALPGEHRQSIAPVLSMLPPWAISIIYILRPDLLGNRDWVPVGFSLTGLLMWWSLERRRLLHLLPIARNRVVDEIEDGVIVLDRQARIADVNPAAARLMGGKDVIGRDAREIYAQWSGAMLGPELGPAASGSEWSTERAQGEMHIPGGPTLEWRISPVAERKSGPAGYLIILRDITERRESEEALRALNASLEAEVSSRTAEVLAQVERTDAILWSVSDGVLMADDQLQIRYVNPAFSAATGFSADDVVARRAESVLGTDLRTLLGPPDQDADGSRQAEARVPRRDGRFIEAVLTVSPMRTAENPVSGYVFTLHDVGKSRALDRARKGFLDNISHQLRTPVTTLRLYTYLLQRAGLPDAHKQSLDVIDAQVSSLQHLIQDILELASLDSGSGVASWDSIAMDVVLQTIVAKFEARIEDAGRQFRGPGQTTALPALRGDLGRLVQAISEVMDNAVRFSSAGSEVSLTATETRVSDRLWVVVSVRNAGLPIPSEEHTRIFERFHRGSAAEIGQLQGTGVGLSIAEAIVHAHGGHIALRSEASVTTFELWFPVVQEPTRP